MADVFDLPDVGEGISEGELVSWLVEEGDHVEEDQPLVEIMTDKATVEIPSPRDGVILERHHEEGDMVEVHSPLLVIGEEGEEHDQQPSASEPKETEETAKQERQQKEKQKTVSRKASTDGEIEQPSTPGRVLATPATRRFAREQDVEIENVSGSGKAGRVLKEDIQEFIEEQKSAASQPVSRRPAGAGEEPVDTMPFRGVRKMVSDQMEESKRNAAHFTIVDEVDMTEIVEARESLKPQAEEKEVHLTYLPFIFKALLPALREFPVLNAELDKDNKEIKLKKYYHFGFACDTEDGLKVPVVRNVDQKNVFELAEEITEKAAAAREGTLDPDKMQGSTFTVTSAGNIGGLFATPVINYPEVAIMGIHEIKDRPVVRDGDIVIRKMMYLSVSLDHRVVDGAEGVRFSNHVIELLENPYRMLAEV